MNLVLVIALISLGVVISLQIWRWTDNRRAAQARVGLARRAKGPASTFDPSLVKDLPEPARRYFLYTIAPGAPIRTVTEIRMRGQIGLGTQNKPNYLPMHAEQILAPPYGLVWELHAGEALMRISGSDGFDGETSWVRFWLMNSIPIVRVGGTSDHARADWKSVV